MLLLLDEVTTFSHSAFHPAPPFVIAGGDAFSSRIIYGLLTGQDLQETVDFAAAASCSKHTIHGDFNLVSFEEVLDLLNGNSSSSIKR